MLSKVVGDDLVAEIRCSQERGNTEEECGAESNDKETSVVKETAVVEETAMVEDDY